MQMSGSCLFFFLFLERTLRKEVVGGGRKRVEPCGRVKVCGEWTQQLRAEIIHFHLNSTDAARGQQMFVVVGFCFLFFCRLNTFQM